MLLRAEICTRFGMSYEYQDTLSLEEHATIAGMAMGRLQHENENPKKYPFRGLRK